jgi:hypothetical protein
MGVSQKLQDIFSNHSETSDKHRDELLKSHYYKTTNKKAIEAVKEVFETTDGFSIGSISEERGEMSVYYKKGGKKAFIIVTIISVRPFETAIDFAVTTETGFLPMDFGFSKKLILEIYKKMDSALPFLGAGGAKR